MVLALPPVPTNSTQTPSNNSALPTAVPLPNTSPITSTTPASSPVPQDTTQTTALQVV